VDSFLDESATAAAAGFQHRELTLHSGFVCTLIDRKSENLRCVAIELPSFARSRYAVSATDFHSELASSNNPALCSVALRPPFGTRTNWAGLTMTVPRGRPKWLADRQTDAIDPETERRNPRLPVRAMELGNPTMLAGA
jgi:hypothetical protein